MSGLGEKMWYPREEVGLGIWLGWVRRCGILSRGWTRHMSVLGEKMWYPEQRLDQAYGWAG